MKNKFIYKGTGCSVLLIVTLIFLISFSCCNKRIEQVLDAAKENRNEIEEVLEHFKNEPDELKNKAAKFLIENMPYHYSFVGEGMEAYDSIYARMAIEPKQFRDSVFHELMKEIDFRKKTPQWDIENLNAEQLIKAVENACDAWSQASWSKEYDIDLFLNYVLPYRLFTEQPSDWRTTISEEYPYLTSNTVWSDKGIQIEAENASFSHAKEMTFGNAFYRKVVMLDQPLATVTFHIQSSLPAKKNLYMRYAATGTDCHVVVSVNGEKGRRVHLHPTKAMTFFRLNRTELEIELQKGDNQITVQYDNGAVGLDCMQLISVEPFEECQEDDYSRNYYRIKNLSTGNCISITDFQSGQADTVRLINSAEETDKQCQLSLDYRGYACWSISTSNGDGTNSCLETNSRQMQENTFILQGKYQNGNNQKWVILPVENGCYKIMCKESGLCLKSMKDETGIERLVQATYTGESNQIWKMEPLGPKSSNQSTYEKGSALAKACKITDVMPQFEWFSFPGSIMPKASSLCKHRTGICRDEAGYTVFLCRYMGIPAAVDFTPHWGNRSRGHLWSVIIKPDGTSTPFYMGRTPGDTFNEYHNYVKPKVFRHQFQLNRTIAKDMKEETGVPELFRIPKFTDVTDEYMVTTDITRYVPSEYSTEKVAYICVFDNKNWVPVYYGNIKNDKGTFPSMGREIVYMAALYENGRMKPFGEAFYVTKEGEVLNIKANDEIKQEMQLLRKHPFLRINDKINMWMSGGKFQGANNPDFSDATDLHVHQGKTTGNWYDIRIDETKRFRYLRYIGPNSSYCNINEMVFFNLHNQPIEGEIIGSKGEKGLEKENVFDHNILTTFQGQNRSDDWVGLKLSEPTQVGRIRYIGRNDGNCIETGDEYELCYWQNNRWKSLCKQIAQGDTLFYENAPVGGLYILHNHTKGKEERIFTYENGEQIWW